MTEPSGRGSGVSLTKEVVLALLPLTREDRAIAANVEGTLAAAGLLCEDDERDHGT